MAQTGRQVLIAIDASEQAEFAVDYYLSKLHKAENSVVLVHVPAILDGVMHCTDNSWEEALAREDDKVRQLKRKFKLILTENGISGRVRIEDGNLKPGEVLCQVAREEKVAMIVMGTRGLGPVQSLIMGSVSNYVLHNAHCAVVICKR